MLTATTKWLSTLGKMLSMFSMKNLTQNQNQQFSNSKQTHPIEKVDRQNVSPPQNPKLPNSKQTHSVDKVDRAVTKARRNIIAAGENLTAWQVSQDALLNLKLDS
nr:hypothetical protein CFP56_48568 [Quercus suber]